MALIKFGAFITDVRGKVGGTVFSKNKSGAYAKNRVLPSNPRTGAQQSVRGFFGSLSTQWRALTQDQREAWSELASTLSFQNKVGDSVKISGIALFQKFNGNLNTMEEPAISVPVALEGVTAVAINDFTVTSDGTTLTSSVTAAEVSDPVANTAYAVFATKGLSAGISNYSNQLRLIGKFPNVAGINTPNAIVVDYLNKYGLPLVGSRVGIQILPINIQTGESGVPVQFDTIVTAT